MTAPRMTVLIGAYNNAQTLERAARSMLDQTVSDIELLIIDDGSTDSTGDVARLIAADDRRTRVLTMPGNVGISRSLNAGLQAAAAPNIAVLDADDWSDARRLERQRESLERRRNTAVVGVRMREVDESGRELVPRTRLAEGEVNGILMRFNPIPNTASAFRRAAALAIGGYDARYKWASDYDLWLRLAEHHGIVVLDEVLATRQMSSRNVAAKREREQIAETIVMRAQAMRRRRSMRNVSGLLPYVVSYATPLTLKRAVRRRIGQAP
jgi:glycosyltransferase involved in cell wall biosynthesis